MILTAINNFVSDKFAELNQRKDTAVKVLQIVNDLQLEQISASQADVNYQLFVSEIVEDYDIEAPGWFLATVRIEFTFNIANKDYTIYKDKFDNYLYLLRNLLVYSQRALSYEADNVLLQSITSVSITNADRFEEDYYKPTLNFTVKGYDEVFADISGTTDITVNG